MHSCNIDKSAYRRDLYQSVSSLEHIVTFFERQHEAYYGRLPSTHPVSRWVNELFHRHFKKTGCEDVDVVINDSWYEVNALATPNRNIYISHGLLRFVDSEDELLFVLGHENRHIQRGHFERTKTALGDFSVRRLHEYQADFESLKDVEEEGNPYGGLLFMKKLSEKQESPSITHGRNIDRFLNMFWMTKLIDLATLRTTTTPLPQFVRDYATSNPSSPLDNLLTEQVDDLARNAWRIPELSLHQAIYTVRNLYPRYARHRGLGMKAYHQFEGDALRDLSETLGRRIREKGFPGDEATLLQGCVLSASAGVDVSDEQHQDSGLSCGLFDQFTTQRDLEAFLAVVNRSVFHSLGLAGIYQSPVIALSHDLATVILEEGLFHTPAFDSSSYLQFSIKASDNLSSLFTPEVRDSLHQRVLSRFFCSGLFELNWGAKESGAYLDDFRKHLPEEAIRKTLKEADLGHLGGDYEEEENEIASLLFGIEPPPAKEMNDRKSVVFSKRPQEDGLVGYSERQTKWKETVDEKIEAFLDSYQGDLTHLVKKAREYLLGMDPFDVLDSKAADRYEWTEYMVSKILDHHIGKLTIENLESAILTYRAAFPYEVPGDFVIDVNLCIADFIYASDEEDHPLNLTGYDNRELLERIHATMTSDDLLKQTYDFVE